MCFKGFIFIMVLGVASTAWSQYGLTDTCQSKILEAEQQRNLDIYSQCGFDNQYQALTHWSQWASQHRAYQAMYELCARYPGTPDGAAFCQKAAAGGNGPALLYQGDKLYGQKKYVEALQSYTQALNSPLLTSEEKGHIAERIGVLYMNPEGSYYNPAKGWPLIERAAEQRGALANNVIGAHAMFGMANQPVDMEKAFKHFWRAILLGCPNAEENLGLFHLVYQNKITKEYAQQLMKSKIFDCQAPTYFIQGENVDVSQRNCNCPQVLQKEEMVSKYPYRLISAGQNAAVLQDETGQRFSVVGGATLPNGAHISEIRKTAIILQEGKTRHIVNLAPDEICVKVCKDQQLSKSSANQPKIKPYRLTFTPAECSDLLYYAERLVNTKLPFVGKKECGFSGEMDAASKLLLSQ